MLFGAVTVRNIAVPALRLCGLTWAGQFLWFSEAAMNQIMALDPHTGEVASTLSCPNVRTDLTTVDGNLLQVVGQQRALRLIDPTTGEFVTEIPNPRPGHVLCGLEATGDGLWMGYEDLRVLELRDADDFRLLEAIPVRGSVAGVTVSDSYIAYADHRAGVINLVDPARQQEIAAVSVNGNPTGITWDGRWIWYCDHTTVQIRAIEVPATLR